MPKTSRQSYGEVIYALRDKDLISEVDLDAALWGAGIESPSAVSRYRKNLVDRGYLTRVGGGCWQLTKESTQTGVITIKVVPKQSTDDVIKALEAACSRFGERVTIETQEVV
jgi:hypothetical protein